MRQSSDAIGLRGENIFFVRLTEPDAERGPLFRPQFLGDKFPFADYLVLLEGSRTGLFFFVQVKSTLEGYTVKERRLRVKVTEANLRGLASFPAPTYVVGVDNIDEGVFIASANEEGGGGITSLSTAHPLNPVNRRQLWEEVRAYWSQSTTSGMPKLDSAFSDIRRS